MSAGQSQIERILIEQHLRSRRRATLLAVIALTLASLFSAVLLWSLSAGLQDRTSEVTQAERTATLAQNRLQAERDYVATLEREAAGIDTPVGTGPLTDEQINAIVQRSSADLRVRYAQLDLVPFQNDANAAARNLQSARDDLEQVTQELWICVGGVIVVLLGLSAIVGLAKRKETMTRLQLAQGEVLDVLTRAR